MVFLYIYMDRVGYKLYELYMYPHIHTHTYTHPYIYIYTYIPAITFLADPCELQPAESVVTADMQSRWERRRSEEAAAWANNFRRLQRHMHDQELSRHVPCLNDVRPQTLRVDRSEQPSSSRLESAQVAKGDQSLGFAISIHYL